MLHYKITICMRAGEAINSDISYGGGGHSPNRADRSFLLPIRCIGLVGGGRFKWNAGPTGRPNEGREEGE